MKKLNSNLTVSDLLRVAYIEADESDNELLRKLAQALETVTMETAERLRLLAHTLTNSHEYIELVTDRVDVLTESSKPYAEAIQDEMANIRNECLDIDQTATDIYELAVEIGKWRI